MKRKLRKWKMWAVIQKTAAEKYAPTLHWNRRLARSALDQWEAVTRVEVRELPRKKR